MEQSDRGPHEDADRNEEWDQRPSELERHPSTDGRAHLVVSVAPSLVERGLKAGEVVKVAAAQVGGGGGGRDTIAQAGGRDPDKLDAALEAAREAIASALEGG